MDTVGAELLGIVVGALAAVLVSVVLGLPLILEEVTAWSTSS